MVTKAEWKVEQGKTEKLQTYDSGLFIGESYFVNVRSQNCLIF